MSRVSEDPGKGGEGEDLILAFLSIVLWPSKLWVRQRKHEREEGLLNQPVSGKKGGEGDVLLVCRPIVNPVPVNAASLTCFPVDPRCGDLACYV